jgi:hypothetical protein
VINIFPCGVRCVRNPGDLAEVIDRKPAAGRSAQRAEILHATGRSPPKRVRVPGSARARSRAGHLAEVVDRDGVDTDKTVGQRAEILHATRRSPPKPVKAPVRCLSIPCDLAQVVDRVRVAVLTTERAEILHATGRSPPKRVSGRGAGRWCRSERISGHLT